MKTRFTSVFAKAAIALLLVILAPPTEAWADWSGVGTGTSVDPYQIDTYAKLKEFADIVNGSNTGASAKLTADIECNDKTWTPIGNNTNKYTGTFDGQGYTITGLSTAFTESPPSYAGLFGYVGTGGVVKNVTLVDAAIYGFDYVGSIAGRNQGTIQNCALIGTSNIRNSGGYSGGIAGYNSGIVNNSYVAIS